MKRLLLLAFLMPLAALPARVTLSNGQSCEYTSATVSPNGNIDAACAIFGNPIVVPPVAVVTPIQTGSCKTLPVGQVSQNVPVTGVQGDVFSAPIPLSRSGIPVKAGTFSFTTESGHPPLGVEVSFSPTPCDVDYYKSHKVGVFTPCGATGSAQSAGRQWVMGEGTFFQCGASPGWYVNYRISACEGTCTQVFNWTAQ